VLVLCGFTTLYAEAPELRNVMPNSWREVTRLSAEEEGRFIAENGNIIEQIKDDILNGDGSSNNRYPDPSYFFIYKQTVGTDNFYRIISTDIEHPDFFSPDISFVQTLVYEKRLIYSGQYNVDHITRQVDNICMSIDIIPGRDAAKGILLTHVLYEKGSRSTYRKDQIAALTGGGYYFMEDIIKNKDTASDLFLIKSCPRIGITASDCLVDPDMPLRYSLQNAFDGDPATSYVENTSNDLMNIGISVSYNLFKRCAVINGYAQNMTTYKNNNRIKNIWPDEHTVELQDNTLSFQYINSANQWLSISDIYRGEKYNDTCLAEYNVYLDGIGWLFGEMDE
jgi:hypothetical protein